MICVTLFCTLRDAARVKNLWPSKNRTRFSFGRRFFDSGKARRLELALAGKGATCWLAPSARTAVPAIKDAYFLAQLASVNEKSFKFSQTWWPRSVLTGPARNFFSVTSPFLDSEMESFFCWGLDLFRAFRVSFWSAQQARFATHCKSLVCAERESYLHPKNSDLRSNKFVVYFRLWIAAMEPDKLERRLDPDGTMQRHQVCENSCSLQGLDFLWCKGHHCSRPGDFDEQ